MPDEVSMAEKKQLVIGMIDFTSHQSTLGREIQYFHEAKSGRTYLEHFLQKVMQVQGVDRFIAFIHQQLEEKLTPYLIRYESIEKAVLPEYEIVTFYNNYEQTKKSRKWCYQSTRGGNYDMTVFDELLPMDMIKDLVKQIDCQALVHFHPEMPFFDVEVCSNMIRCSKSMDENKLVKKGLECFPLLIDPDILGCSPSIITNFGIKTLKDKNWGPYQALRPSPSKDGAFLVRKIIEKEPDHQFFRTNLLLRTKRDRLRLEKMIQKLPESEWVGKNFSKMDALQVDELFDELPREIDVELGSGSLLPQERFPVVERGELDISVLEKLIEETCDWEDALLTLCNQSDFFGYSKLNELKKFLESGHRPFGLHLWWDAKSMLEHVSEAMDWMQMDVDIITLNFTSLGFDPEVQLADLEPSFAELFKFHSSLKNPPCLHLETHKYEENWRDFEVLHTWALKYTLSYNWVPCNDFAGQVQRPDYITLFEPRHRYPCEKLKFQCFVQPDGEVSLCKQDIFNKFSQGNVRDSSLQEIWVNAQRRSLLKQHAKNDYSGCDLCEKCSAWMHP